MCVVSSRFLSDGFVAFWVSTDSHNADYHVDALTKNAWSQMMTVLSKWKTVELTACEPGGEVLLLGYLLRSLPALPQVIDAASVATDVPDLVG